MNKIMNGIYDATNIVIIFYLAFMIPLIITITILSIMVEK